MNKKRIHIRTITVIVIVLILFTILHMYNHVAIQAARYNSEWGKEVEIGTAFLNMEPLISQVEDKILVLTFNDAENINYYLVGQDGSLIEKNTVKIQDFDKNKVKDIYLLDDDLLYIKDRKLFKAIFKEGAGFTDPICLVEDIDGFNVSTIDNSVWINTYDKGDITLYTLDNQLHLQNSFSTSFDNIENIQVKELNNKKYVFIGIRVDHFIHRILGGTIEDNSNCNFKVLDEIVLPLGKDINEVYVENIQDKLIMVHKIVESKRGENLSVCEIRIINPNSMNMDAKEIYKGRITELNIYDLGSEFQLFKNGNKVSLIGAASNIYNKYTDYDDIFIADIGIDGKFSGISFISNTHSISKAPSILTTEFGQYAAWIDIKGEKYTLVINSTNNQFIDYNRDVTKDEYKTAFFRASASIFYAFAFMFLKGFMMFVYILFIYLIAGFIMNKLKVKDDKIKFIVFIVIYIAINIFLFKDIYYTGNTVLLMPEILKTGFVPYIMPIIINLISALILYAFYRDRIGQYTNYLIYVIFFIAIDVYLSNLLYVPFAMIRTLTK